MFNLKIIEQLCIENTNISYGYKSSVDYASTNICFRTDKTYKNYY